jgi:muconolactone delta-isomerase
MQFLAVSARRTERFTDAEFAALAEAEMAQARVLYGHGFLRQIWHRADVPGACMILEAESIEDVRARLGTLPFVRAGMLEMTIVPLKPYAGFAPRVSTSNAQLPTPSAS